MKRCPHCEFIYNDDQVSCDMDGQALVYDATTLASVESETRPTNARPGSMVLIAISGFVIAVVAWLSFTAGPIAKADEDISSAAPNIEQPIELPSVIPALDLRPTNVVNEASVSTVAVDDARAESNVDNRATVDKRLTIPRGVAPLPRLQPLPRLPVAKPSPRVEQVKTEPRESKVKSFLKKTGRAIKKPFKF